MHRELAMLLDHPSLEPFEPIITDIYDTALGGAFRGLASTGLHPGDEWHTEAALVYRAACLPGFKKAQDALGAKVIELELNIRELAKEETKQRENRDVLGTKQSRTLRKILQNRQLVLRRLVDGMLWLLFLPDKWILRRLRLEGGVRRVNVAEIRDLLKALAHQHAKDEDAVWIICDLSTLAQLGDVIYARWQPGRGRMKLVVGELKVGAKNILLHNLLHEPGTADLGVRIANISKQLGPKSAEQAIRMARQEQRLKNFEHVQATDEGINPMSGEKFRMTKNAYVSKDYRDQIWTLISRAKLNGSSAVTLDECLHLLAIRNDPGQINEGLMVAHRLFHMRAGDFCKLPGPEESRKQEMAAIVAGPMAINLLDFNMRTSIAMPPLLWYPRDAMLDVLMGRVKIFAQLDHERFFELASGSGLKMRFIRGKEAARIKSAKLSGPLPEYRDLRFIRAENTRGKTAFFGARFFAKVYTELVRPIDLYEMTRDLVEEAGRDGMGDPLGRPVVAHGKLKTDIWRNRT
jgi:hypothetical protein